MIKEAKEIGTKESEVQYGCLMAYLDLPGMTEIQSEILEEDLSDEGKAIEDEPHITILYGFMLDHKYYDYNGILDSVAEIMIEPIDDIELRDVGVFENEEYDVLKISVESSKLKRMHNYFRENFEDLINVTYPDYNPHITIAYLKPGTGKKYLDLDLSPLLLDEEETLTSNYIVYSENDEEEIKPFTYTIDFDGNVEINAKDEENSRSYNVNDESF